MKVVYSGLESSGKSLKLAMQAAVLVNRNSTWRKISQKERPIWSNIRFADHFVEYAESLQVPIRYFRDVEELIQVTEADVIIDELATYFDSRMWQELSLDARMWLAQAAKQGIEIYAGAQDFAQVDKAMRRLVNHLFLIRKVAGSQRPAATRPPVKRIWGMCAVFELNPQSYKEDEKEYLSYVPGFFTIQRRYCEIFDTQARTERSSPPPLRHIERRCAIPTCRHLKVIHV